VLQHYDNDLARKAAVVLEDLGVIDLDLVVKDIAKFGAEIRHILTGGSSGLTPRYAKAAQGLALISNGVWSADHMVTSLARLAGVEWCWRNTFGDQAD